MLDDIITILQVSVAPEEIEKVRHQRVAYNEFQARHSQALGIDRTNCAECADRLCVYQIPRFQLGGLST